jgi:hypothetical protein
MVAELPKAKLVGTGTSCCATGHRKYPARKSFGLEKKDADREVRRRKEEV